MRRTKVEMRYSYQQRDDDSLKSFAKLFYSGVVLNVEINFHCILIQMLLLSRMIFFLHKVAKQVTHNGRVPANWPNFVGTVQIVSPSPDSPDSPDSPYLS